jgi:hypothetical protein
MIQSIELKHTNPSLGPYEQIISYSLTNSEAHKAEFDQLLEGTTVNGKFDLKTYLTAYKNKDKATTDKFFAANYKGDLRSGETISKFKMTLIGGFVVEVSDLRTTILSGYYPDFIRYVVKNGHRYESSRNDIFPETDIEMKSPISKRLDKIDDTDLSI